jgi:hypothetical protein
VKRWLSTAARRGLGFRCFGGAATGRVRPIQVDIHIDEAGDEFEVVTVAC